MQSNSLRHLPGPRNPNLTEPKTRAWKHKQEMAEEALLLLLPKEMVSVVYTSTEQGEVENGCYITKLETMGFQVGQGLKERFAKDTAKFKHELDTMKSICKDVWTTVFKKTVQQSKDKSSGHLCTSGQQICLLTLMSAGKQ